MNRRLAPAEVEMEIARLERANIIRAAEQYESIRAAREHKLAWLHLAGEGYPGRRANDLGQSAWSPLFAKHRKAASLLVDKVGFDK